MTALVLNGCGSQSASDETASRTEQETIHTEDDSVLEDEEAPFVYEEYTLEDLAEMNGYDDPSVLNVLFDSEGNMVFLGDCYGYEKVTNEQEAFDSLQHISSLINMGDARLDFFRRDESIVTGNIYYTFNQVASGEIDGEEVVARYYNSLVKVITDRDGNLIGVSSDLNHSDDDAYDFSELINQEAAENEIIGIIDKSRGVYTDYTEFVYWTDPGSVRNVSDGKVCPAWVVYTDADCYEKDNREMKDYQVFVISARPASDYEGNESVYILDRYYINELGSEDNNGDYVSALYFDGMKDAGEFTYTLDLDWVKASYPAYKGEKTMDVTVHVMQNESDGLYYLGDLDRRIAVANSYDFDELNTLNSYVTDNPNDKDSWHFYDETSGDITYFNDSDYVLGSYSTMVDVYDEFANRYDLRSVDRSEMPILLKVYATEGQYPESADGFIVNAYNDGQVRDWQVMATSPALAECLNPVTMGHEFTHGINSTLSNTQYMNAPGAIMESFADIVGMQMAMINGYVGDDEAWILSGKYYDVMRSMKEPEDYNQPKYIYGKYYINDTAPSLAVDFDNGGVHINSGICNYLAYAMTNGVEGMECTPYSVEDNLDMWFEALYCANYMTDYYDVARYLIFASESMGITDDRYLYLWDLLEKMALIPNEDGEYEFGFEEEGKIYTMTANFENEELAEMVDLGAIFIDENEIVYGAGSFYDDNTITYLADSDKKMTPALCVGDRYNGESIGNITIDESNATDYILDYSLLTTETGTTAEIGNAENCCFSTLDAMDCIDVNENGIAEFTPAEPGNYLFSFAKDKEAGEYNIVHVYVPE